MSDPLKYKFITVKDIGNIPQSLTADMESILDFLRRGLDGDLAHGNIITALGQ